MRFDLDPSMFKVVLIGIFLFLESIVGALLILLQQGHIPDLIEIMIALLVACMVGITYALTFLRLQNGQTTT